MTYQSSLGGPQFSQQSQQQAMGAAQKLGIYDQTPFCKFLNKNTNLNIIMR